MQRKSSESVLIDLARQSLFDFFAGGDKEDQEFPVDDETVSGVFVTLKHDGMLRGCRGCVEGTYPLRKTIWEISRSSAFDTPPTSPKHPIAFEGDENATHGFIVHKKFLILLFPTCKRLN